VEGTDVEETTKVGPARTPIAGRSRSETDWRSRGDEGRRRLGWVGEVGGRRRPAAGGGG